MGDNRILQAKEINGVVARRNYILNYQASVNTAGWATYADAAASRPVDGTGGSPTITWTRTTSSPLRGIASFLFTKDAANRQGEGASYDFTIDNADLAKVLQIRFDYEIASGTYSGGTSSTDSDLIAYIYRVTATGRLIEPSVIKLDGGVSGIKYSYRGEFQTDSDATGYRLILHVATTSASAYTVRLDNIVISPSKNVNGEITTPWTAYTPTVTGLGTIVTVAMFYRRVGDSIEIAGSFGTGTAAGTAITISLPSGISWDTAKVGTTEYFTCGTMARVAGTVNPNHPSASGGPFVLYPRAAVTSVSVAKATSSGQWSAANGTDIFGNTEFATVQFTLPVAGWGATATLGQDADTRVVAARYSTAVNQTLNTATATIINYTVKNHDSLNAVTTGAAWSFRVPVAGIYAMKAAILLQGTTNWGVGETLTISLKKNNTVFSTEFEEIEASQAVNSYGAGISIYDEVECVVGDSLQVEVTQGSGGNIDLETVATFNTVAIHRLSGPSQIAASEIVAAKASGDPASASSGNPVIFPTMTYDTHNGYNASTGRYTVPGAGIIRVHGFITSANTGVALTIYKNASTDTLAGATDSNGECAYTGSVRCVSGDILDIRPNNTLDAATGSTIHFERLGGI